MRLTGTTVIGNILAMTPKWIEPIKLDTSVRAYVTARGDVGDSPYSGLIRVITQAILLSTWMAVAKAC